MEKSQMFFIRDNDLFVLKYVLLPNLRFTQASEYYGYLHMI